MRLKALAFSVALALSVPAAAADWWWLGTFGSSPLRQNVYIDKTSLKKSGRSLVAAWTFHHLENPMPNNGELSSRALQTYDCKQRKTRVVARSAYAPSGALISGEEYQDAPVWEIRPDTAADIVWRYACEEGMVTASRVGDPAHHSSNLFRPVAQSALVAN